MNRTLKKMIRNKYGFTLIEMIIALSLISLVVGIAGGFIKFSTHTEDLVKSEYELQADMRQAADNLNNSLRDASVTFLMPGSISAGSLAADWSYIGLPADKSSIVQYTWDATSHTHKPTIIVASRAGITYDLNFSNQTDTKLVGYKLTMNTTSGKDLSVYSTLSAINSVAVDINSSEKNPATIIAYRTDPRPKAGTNKTVTIAISLVIDDSGSMGWNMAGTNQNPSTAYQRKTIMKTKADALIESFPTNVYTGVVGFSGEGSVKCALTKLVDATAKQKVKNAVPVNASGGTNTGDGLRLAYYQLKNYTKSNASEVVLYYMIVLTDGDPTFFSHTADGKYNSHDFWGYRLDTAVVPDADFQTDSETIDNQGGTGSDDPKGNCLNYTKVVSDKLTVNDSTLGIKTFVIGFTGDKDDIKKAKSIACYCNGLNPNTATADQLKSIYFEATSGDSLGIAFNAIQESILTEYWHIYGPSGNPND